MKKVFFLASFLLISFGANADELCGKGMAFNGIKKCMHVGSMVKRTDIRSNKKFKIVGFAPYYTGGAHVLLQTGTSVRYNNPQTKGGSFPKGSEPVHRRFVAPY